MKAMGLTTARRTVLALLRESGFGMALMTEPTRFRQGGALRAPALTSPRWRRDRPIGHEASLLAFVSTAAVSMAAASMAAPFALTSFLSKRNVSCADAARIAPINISGSPKCDPNCCAVWKVVARGCTAAELFDFFQ
jgi:hypothetical protein